MRVGGSSWRSDTVKVKLLENNELRRFEGDPGDTELWVEKLQSGDESQVRFSHTD